MGECEKTICLDREGDGARITSAEFKAMLDVPEIVRLGDFRDVRLLGKGGVGEVYSVRDNTLLRNVALKTLRPEQRYRRKAVNDLIREARTTAQIDHPNVVPVYNIGVLDDYGVYFTMKNLSGGETLQEVITRLRTHVPGYDKRYSLRRRMEIFVSICNTMAFAHSRGVLHRDLKPGNIMLGEYGEIMIMDWGMALYRKEIARDGHAILLEGEGQAQAEQVLHKEGGSDFSVGGTPAFMSPEQVRGYLSELDEAADQYSLGAILHCLLTLQNSPFEENLETKALLGRVLAGAIVPPRKRAPRLKIPRELEAICTKAMKTDKRQRYESVLALATDVRNYLDFYPVSAYTSKIGRLAKLCRRRPLIPATLLGAGFALLVTYAGIGAQKYLEQRDFQRQIDSRYEELMRKTAMAKHEYFNSKNDARLPSEAFLLAQSEAQMIASVILHDIEGAKTYSNYSSASRNFAEKTIEHMLNYYLATENSEQLGQFFREMRSRWQGELLSVLGRDAKLSRSYALQNRNEAMVRIECNRPSRVTVVKRLFPPVKVTPGEKIRELPDEAAPFHGTLPAGEYLFRISGRFGAFSLILKMPPSSQRTIRLELPEKVPDDSIFVADCENSGNALSYGFLAGREVVSLGEYLEFWKTLTDPQARSRCMARTIFDPATGKIEPLWDAQGNLRGRFRPDDPVTGISGVAAREYCRYLSEKHGVTYRLPTPQEWIFVLKALRSDQLDFQTRRGGDLREFTANGARSSRFQVMSERDLTPSAAELPRYDGGFPAPDLGFRWVIDPDAGKEEAKR
ncbi:MAG: bifunctional serine/threonine-protein kinase/formylglycine-generating enzyme family protein [Victivallaceae bacterium]|nr:bifunctional serine/threonine-protein kinase/formylglycine-generating enzyme family protein [Victivallaceae bacterium]